MSDEYTINEQEELTGYGDVAEKGDEPVFDGPGNRKIAWNPMDFPVETLYYKKKRGDLDLKPSWQRNYVFDKAKASRLIESVLLDVPLPAVYLAEEADGTLSVIDGQQRLTTFFGFIDDQFPVGNSYTEFKLSGLEILTELKGLKYASLEKSFQRKIGDTPIHAIIIKKESDDDVKFEIFERLNTGSMKLNEDEIRNSVYRGPYIDLLDELEEDKTFGKLVNKPNFKNRMLYRGMILRFLALSEKDYRAYRPSMKQFCNKELRERRNLSKEKANEYRKRFRQCIDLCHSVFGENAFRRFSPGKDENNKDGSWVISRINMALFDVQMCCFAKYDQSQFQGHWNEIRDRMLDLMCNDQEFGDAIEIQTSSTVRMRTRLAKWLGVLDSIVSNPTSRNFSYEIKRQFFEKDPTCGICHNHILAIEDAEVDHIDPYSKGGPTTIENAQIAHRYCNRHKSDNPV
jgi:hypothetical protein